MARLRPWHGARELTLAGRLGGLHWPLVALVLLIALIGYGVLYSAAGGSHEPWAWRHGLRLAIGIVAMIVVAVLDIRIVYRLAYPVYAMTLVLLIWVEVMGDISKGAQRWLDLGVVQIQPSELMKLALICALARFFHGNYLEEVRRPLATLVPLFLIFAPAVLVLKQPDLGTAVMLVIAGVALLFLAGIPIWRFAVAGLMLGGALPLVWARLHDYQRQRIVTFLDPESDPLGAGYHIIQSKIALGAGGLMGRGYLQGSQAQLNFLPEKQTDFAFTMLAEETGFVGSSFVLCLYLVILAFTWIIAVRSQSQFGRLLAMGLSVNFALYVFINVAMVTGLIPVVGVPLPLISYGGTAMLTVLLSLGLVMSVDVNRDVSLPRVPKEL
jgi:rod shape determining protein RodA